MVLGIRDRKDSPFYGLPFALLLLALFFGVFIALGAWIVSGSIS